MDIQFLIKNNVQQVIKTLYKLDIDNVVIEHPENESFGDFATSISLRIAKDLNRTPFEIAQEICDELNNIDFKENEAMPYSIFESIVAVQPGFINFSLSKDWLEHELVEIIEKKDTYGSSKFGGDKKIIVEFSQMNTNKPQHIGHSRNNFLGSSVANILEFTGYDVIKSVYAGDIGAHETKSMLMYKLYGENKEPDKKSDHFVGDFYVLFSEEVAKDPKLEEESKQMLIDWENRDTDVRNLWKRMNDWVYEGWEETYKDQNITYDIREYESDHVDIGKEIAEYAVEQGIAERDASGAIIARLEKYNLPDKVLLRADGTSLYITKDLQLAKDSFEKYGFEKRIYVVDYRQSDYFKQVFKILEILGFDWQDRLYHLSYGTVTLPGGSMSSRRGVIISADEVFEKLVEFEKEEIAKSIKSVKSPEETVKAVALSAFRYGMLKVDAKQNIVFDYDQVTKFEGNTGPYLMYSYARARSVLEKAGFGESFDIVAGVEDFVGVEINDQEVSLLRILYKFPEIVEKSANLLEPHHLANYLFDVASRFNSFYAASPVLDAGSTELKEFRLSLVFASSQILKNGLKLLGINVVEKM